jgi:DNA invertase Pin-like site-specific DNA recombinase
MLVGYIRLSLQEPTAERQLDVLRQAGCEKVFIDERNNDRREQPGLQKAWTLMQPGDTLVVCRFDRLGYSFKQVVEETMQSDSASLWLAPSADASQRVKAQ